MDKIKQWRKSQRRSWKPAGPGKDDLIADLRLEVHNLEHRAHDAICIADNVGEIRQTARKLLDLATGLSRKVREHYSGREAARMDHEIAILQDFQRRHELLSEKAAKREACPTVDGLSGIQRRGLMGSDRHELWDHMIYHRQAVRRKRPRSPFIEAAVDREIAGMKALYKKKIDNVFRETSQGGGE